MLSEAKKKVKQQNLLRSLVHSIRSTPYRDWPQKSWTTKQLCTIHVQPPVKLKGPANYYKFYPFWRSRDSLKFGRPRSVRTATLRAGFKLLLQSYRAYILPIHVRSSKFLKRRPTTTVKGVFRQNFRKSGSVWLQKRLLVLQPKQEGGGIAPKGLYPSKLVPFFIESNLTAIRAFSQMTSFYGLTARRRSELTTSFAPRWLNWQQEVGVSRLGGGTRYSQNVRVRRRGLKFYWKTARVKAYAPRRRLVKKRVVLQRYWRKIWGIKRFKKLNNFFKKLIFREHAFRRQKLLCRTVLRLDAFLVYSFKIPNLRYARYFIERGHIKVNGSHCRRPEQRLLRFDVITLSWVAMRWLRIKRSLRKKRRRTKMKRFRKKRKGFFRRKGHKIRPHQALLRRQRHAGRKAHVKREHCKSGGVIFGPRVAYAIVWNLRPLRLRFRNYKKLYGGLTLQQVVKFHEILSC